MRTRIAIGLVSVLVLGAVGVGIGAALSQRSNATGPTAPTSAAPQPTSPATTSSPATTPAKPEVRPMVLAISVDGLNPQAITRLGVAGAPNFHRLMSEGASTLNARTAYERTITLPNHTGMLTGRGVSGTNGHGVTFNSDNGGSLKATHGSYVPSMFDVAHDRGLTTVFLAEKDKFEFLMRSWDSQHGAPDTTGRDDGRDKTDVDVVGEHAEVMRRLQTVLKGQEADLTFLHLKAPDEAGHDEDWLSRTYVDAVRSVDRDLGQILDTVEAIPELEDRLTILLTADHGGPEGDDSHGKASSLSNYRIPFMAWGRGVKSGVDMYDASTGRADPGTGRPTYQGNQPIRNLDIANTALRLLGLDPIRGIPSSSWPRVQLR